MVVETGLDPDGAGPLDAPGITLNASANILRAVAGAGVLSGYDQLQLIVFGKKFSSGGG